ncbi:hypothetical protein [Paenibacillus paridis]|uniref:hypothetical protein n=1 Tax=Paenibacillus paridis TaxID=2583376 RepID=UPI001EE3D163|nr:hypothetical protein [Paenibacillus paridis]
MRFSLSQVAHQLRHKFAPELVAESADYLFHFTECAFDPEAVSVQANDVRPFQSQVGTHEDGQLVTKPNQDKTQFLVQPLSPQHI